MVDPSASARARASRTWPRRLGRADHVHQLRQGYEPVHVVEVVVEQAGVRHDRPDIRAGLDVGEAAGVWLWLLAWPATAAVVLLTRFSLIDMRERGEDLDLPYGALTPRLR